MIAVARCLEIFSFLALAGCGFGCLRRVESLLSEVLDCCPRADPAGVNIVADGDSFAWLGCKGGLIDTKPSTVGDRFEMGDRFVGHWFGQVVFGMKVRAAGDRVEGFGLSGKNIGMNVSADCDSVVVPSADADVDSVVVVGILEAVWLAPSLVGIGVVVSR